MRSDTSSVSAARCDGCGFLAYEEAVNRYDVQRAVCMDPDKPASGKRRTVAVSSVGKPRGIPRPAWCKRP